MIMSKNEFLNLGLDQWLITQCRLMNITSPSPVQAACIPKILFGHNCIGCAKTGSGKTAAFALPILQKFSEDPFGIYALILTPTRELAYQIADHFLVFGKPVNLRISVIVGGTDMMLQGRDMGFIPHIVIATPGRLVDHINTYNNMKFNRIKYFVMDEADRLLEGYFNEQLATIIKLLPSSRQNLVFSATINDALTSLCKLSMNNSQLFIWRQESEVITVDSLEQQYILTPFHVKDSYLVYIILKFLEKKDNNALAIIFTSSCKKCHVLHILLKKLGISNLPIHSNLTQKQRLVALSKFKSGTVKILIATDLASRGLDIPMVQLVLNHTIPKCPEDYVHRVGRTARAGRAGKSLTMISPRDIGLLKEIEAYIGTRLSEQDALPEKEILKILPEVALTKREAEMDLERSDFDHRKRVNVIKAKILKGEPLTPEEEAECSGLKRVKGDAKNEGVIKKKKHKKREN